MIAELLLQLQLHAHSHPSSGDSCILYFTREGALPTQKGWYNTEHGSVWILDIRHMCFLRYFSHTQEVWLKVRLKWSYWQTVIRTILKSRSVVSQLSTCSRWRGTSCSSNISQTLYCLQVQCLAKKKLYIFFLEIRTQPSEQVSGKRLRKLLGTTVSCHIGFNHLF